MKSTVTLSYRDGANFKSTVDFKIDNALIKKAKAKYGKDFDDQDFPNVKYTALGISREEFHQKIGWPYVRAYDHPYVIVTEIKKDDGTLRN